MDGINCKFQHSGIPVGLVKNAILYKDGDQTQTQALDQAREKLKKLLDFIKALRKVNIM